MPDTIINPLDYYLCILKPIVVFTGRVNGTPSSPYISIPYDGGSVVSTPVAGYTMKVGTVAGSNDIGEVRVRAFSGTVTGTIIINESSDVGPQIQDNHYITILREFRLWAKVPRQDASDPNNIIFYEDYNVQYTDQLQEWSPIAVAGPPAVVFLENGTGTAQFVGDESYTLATGSSISVYNWQAPDSVEGSSSGIGTEGNPVVFNFTSAGQFPVNLSVTDSVNGKVGTNHTWAFVLDPNDPDAITQFDSLSTSFDRNQGGGNADFTVYESIPPASIPTEAMIVLASKGELSTPTGTWPFRGNVHFVGYITDGSITQDPFLNTTSFQAASITALMRNLAIYPARLEHSSAPSRWTEAYYMDVARIISFLAFYRSTLSLMASIIEFPYKSLIAAQDFGPGTLYGQISEILKSAWGRMVANHQGVLYPEIDYQIMLDTERANVSNGKNLDKHEWIGAARVQERPAWSTPVRKVKMDGVLWDPVGSGTATPLFTEAPGEVQDDFGNERNTGGLILSSQGDLNIRSGRDFGKSKSRYPAINIDFINDGSFLISPQMLYPIQLSSGDNNRGLTLNTQGLIQRIRQTYDFQHGIVASQIEFEISTTGTAGTTITMPPRPPSATGNGQSNSDYGYDPAPPIWDEEIVSIILTNLTAGVYVSDSSGANWTNRVSGLPGTETNEVLKDILVAATTLDTSAFWLTGEGFVAYTTDGGQNWTDLTGDLGTPPNTAGDSPAPVATDLSYKDVTIDPATGDLYIQAEWDNGTEWRHWIVKYDGSWTWTGVSGVVGLNPDDVGAPSWGINSNPDDESYNDNDSVTNYANTGAWGDATDSGGSLNAPTFKTDIQNGKSMIEFVRSSSESLSYGTTPGKPSEYTIIIAIIPDLTGTGSNDTIGIFASHPAGSVGSYPQNGVWGELAIFNYSSAGNNTLHYLFGDSTSGFGSKNYSQGSTVDIINDDEFSVVAERHTSGETFCDLWLNGVQQSINTTFRADVGNPAGTAYETRLGHLGALSAGTQGFYNGYIGRILVVDSALTDEQIEGYTDYFRAYYGELASESRPLGIEADQYAGAHIWTTEWDSANIRLYKRTTAMAEVSNVEMAAATETEINDRTYYAKPFSLGEPSGASDTCFVFGRWNDGSVKHLAKTTDGAATLGANIGDGSWGTGWVSAFFALDQNTLYAFVAGGSRALWRSLDAGSSWTQLSTLPFDVKAASLSANGLILIVNRSSGSNQVSLSNADFSAWTDVTNGLPTTGKGSVIWA